jgi:glucose/arabinose dehydrogenase
VRGFVSAGLLRRGSDMACDGFARWSRAARALLPVLFVAWIPLAMPHAAAADPVLPANFEAYDAVPGATWTTPPTGIALLPGGRMLVIEKGGRLWSVSNGIRRPTPMLDISAEVLDESDRGMLGITVDPNYVQNHWIYLLYSVDPDSNNVDTNDDAYGRLSRFTVGFGDSNTIAYSSRVVLLGRDWRHGPLSASITHSIGDLQWGSDGSLFVSAGDGAQYTTIDAGGQDPNAFGPTKTDPNEDIGAFRAQYIGSLCGKILRIRPSSGCGYASNPYWDGDSTSVQSRVWAYGLRNPFRFTVRPGTGGPDPTSGNPGTLYIGDVGWSLYEEMNVASTPGQNFAWPCYEGFEARGSYQNATPAHHGCSTIGTATNPAPITSPLAAWNHTDPTKSSPAGFSGNCSIGGSFYTGTRFPAAYRTQYFFGDYGQDWIKVAQVNASNGLVQILPFGTSMEGPVDIEYDAANDELIVVSITTSIIRRIRYTAAVGNGAPAANANASPRTGVAPLPVTFSSAGTTDPDNDPMTLTWNFGDGQGASGASPSHTYTNAGLYAAVLTADDGHGGIGRDTVWIAAMASNNFPGTSVRDNFDRPNGGIGGAWADPVNGLGSLTINANALVQTCCTYETPVWTGQAFGPDQEAYITLAQITPNAPEHDLMLKLQSASYASAHIEVRYDAVRAGVYCATFQPGPGWIDLGGPIPATFVAGDRLGARAFRNGTLQVFRNNTLIGTRDFSAWPLAAQGGWTGLTLDRAYSSRLEDFGGGNIVINPNTPPVAMVTAPLDSTFYTLDPVILQGTGSDAEQSSASLGYHWEVMLHHNNHVHPDVFSATTDTTSFVPEDHEDGTGVWYELRFMVSDSQALTDTAIVLVWPEVNLTPAALSVSPDPPAQGANAIVSFWLRNLGHMRSRNFHWVVRDGAAAALAEGDTLVEGRDSVWVSFLVPPGTLAPGSHDLRVVADTLGQERELVETDNAVTLTVNVGGGGVTGVAPAPRLLALSPGRPNPSRGAVAFDLDLPAASTVRFDVYDLQGRLVWSAPQRAGAAGRLGLRWDGRMDGGSTAPTGVYVARVGTGNHTLTRRFALIR